jgi:hypothetical protein
VLRLVSALSLSSKQVSGRKVAIQEDIRRDVVLCNSTNHGPRPAEIAKRQSPDKVKLRLLEGIYFWVLWHVWGWVAGNGTPSGSCMS